MTGPSVARRSAIIAAVAVAPGARPAASGWSTRLVRHLVPGRRLRRLGPREEGLHPGQAQQMIHRTGRRAQHRTPTGDGAGLGVPHHDGEPGGAVLSVNVGMPKDVPWQGKTVFTGVFKDPVSGPRRVRKLNVDGDGQGDLAGHGGEQRAVFVYQIDSYRYWERELGRDDFVYGQFGENFTVEGLGDDEVCIGDRYRIGTALFEVTQPRVTCYRVGIRMNDPRIPALLVSHRRPGFYFRVLEEGDVQAGDEIVKLASGPEQMTVAEVDALLYLPGHTRQQLLRALRIPALSPGWQASFRALLDGEPGSGNAGLAVTSPPPAWPGFRR
jgi:MOSC domain-containing protein YiiM